MRFLRICIHRLRSLLQRSKVDDDLERELQLHIEQLTREHIAAGMDEAEARRSAQRAFGPLGRTKEECRDMRRISLIEDLIRDLIYAFRILRRSPGFTLTVVLSLALGIGANTAIFSLVNAVLLRSLPVHEPQQLVEISRRGGSTLSYPMYEAIRNRNQVFSGVLATSSGRFAASLRLGDADLGDGHYTPVSGGYFPTLGLSPVIGRLLTEEDLASANTTVISYGLWQRASSGDPSILGKALRVGNRSYTIVGVAPAAFTGLSAGRPVDLWLPITFWSDRQALRNPVAMMFRVVARRKPGVTEEQARANVELLARQWSAEWKFERPMQVETVPASGGLNQLRRRFSRPLLVLMTIVALLLLLAAGNAANLLLARASARQREIGVRLSLGASRMRVIRQLLTESFLLGGAAGTAGLLIGSAATGFLVRFFSSSLGRFELAFTLDAVVLTFTLCTSLVVVLLFGLAPAVAATKVDLTPSFRTSSLLAARGPAARPEKFLVVAQVAISGVLLVGALLFARSLQTLAGQDAGFQPQNVLLFNTSVAEGTPAGGQRVRVYQGLLEGLSMLTGVRSVALSSESLFSGNTWSEAIRTRTFTPRPGQDRESVLLAVSPGFFRTMGTQMLRGRDFESRDDEGAARVAIVNESMSRYYFGEEDSVGKTFFVEHSALKEPWTVVGVVRDAKYKTLREKAPRIVYLPFSQLPGMVGGANIAIRTVDDPEKMADLIRKEIGAQAPSLRVGGVMTQARLVEGTIAQDRMLAQLSGFFGAVAAALVILGLYGVTAYEIARRTAEIGVRIALGARRGDILRLVLGRSMTLVASGMVLGLMGGVGLSRFVEGLLFGVVGTDPVSLSLGAGVLLGVGAAAAYWPARRATRLDPITATRYE